MSYPDLHPDIREHKVTVTLPGGERRQYMPREQWERVAEERDELRRVLAMISAWRLSSGIRDSHLDRLLGRVGETYERARATAGVIRWAKSSTGDAEKEES